MKGGGKGGKKTVADARGDGKRRFYVLIGVIALAGIAVLGYQAMGGGGKSNWTLTEITLVPNQGHVIGSDTAPVEVVEFADFECPACGQFANLTEPDLRARLVNTGAVRFRFVDFPLDMHPNARTAHMAAWCAAEQNKFWEMHDRIFATQDRWNTQATSRPQRVLADQAEQIGVNMDQYNACMSTNKYAGQIQSNVDVGIQQAVGSTPTFVIGNRKISSSLPYDELKRHIDEVTAEVRAASGATKAANAKSPATKSKSP